MPMGQNPGTQWTHKIAGKSRCFSTRITAKSAHLDQHRGEDREAPNHHEGHPPALQSEDRGMGHGSANHGHGHHAQGDTELNVASESHWIPAASRREFMKIGTSKFWWIFLHFGGSFGISSGSKHHFKSFWLGKPGKIQTYIDIIYVCIYIYMVQWYCNVCLKKNIHALVGFTSLISSLWQSPQSP